MKFCTGCRDRIPDDQVNELGLCGTCSREAAELIRAGLEKTQAQIVTETHEKIMQFFGGKR